MGKGAQVQNTDDILADNMECLWLCYMESQGLCVPSFRLLAWLGGVLYGRLHSHFRNITYISTVWEL